ncbi:MAG: hypothetical protein QM539_10775, partial [Alphaproteobacteria bacterium]|nr:hypothetical protein [Alphaproteobacteria bacterium]
SAAFTNAGATQLVSLYVGSALSGGITAQLTGSDFLQGASRGLIIAALNHSLELGLNGPQRQQEDNEKKVQEIRNRIIKVINKFIELNPDDYSNPQKCNELVMKIIDEASYHLDNHYLASDFANPNDIFSELPITIDPHSGDIGAFEFPFSSGATGHSGFITIKNGIKHLIYAAPLYVLEKGKLIYIPKHIQMTPIDFWTKQGMKFIYRTYNSNNIK